MDNHNKPGDLGKQTRHRAWALSVALGLGLTVLTGSGCNTTPKQHTGDPLLGETIQQKGPNGQPLPPAAPTKTSAATPSSSAPFSSVPPFPASNTAASTAAMAANPGTSVAGGRDLAINDATRPNWTLTPNQAGNPIAGTPVVQPIPRDNSVPAGPGNPFGVVPPNTGNNNNNVFGGTTNNNPNTSNPTIATASWSADKGAPAPTGPLPPLGTNTTDVLVSTLQGKGAVGLRQENVLDGVRVSCYVPARSNPQNLRYLETTARDYPTALQAISQQIDQ